MTEEEEIRRGHEAKRLLESPLFKSAFDTVEAGIVDAMRRVPMGDANGQQTLILSLQVLSKVRGYIAEVAQTGQLAALAKQESMGRRILNRVRGA